MRSRQPALCGAGHVHVRIPTIVAGFSNFRFSSYLNPDLRQHGHIYSSLAGELRLLTRPDKVEVK